MRLLLEGQHSACHLTDPSLRLEFISPSKLVLVPWVSLLSGDDTKRTISRTSHQSRILWKIIWHVAVAYDGRNTWYSMVVQATKKITLPVWGCLTIAPRIFDEHYPTVRRIHGPVPFRASAGDIERGDHWTRHNESTDRLNAPSPDSHHSINTPESSASRSSNNADRSSGRGPHTTRTLTSTTIPSNFLPC